MISFSEMILAFMGCQRLLRRDDSALSFFDLSERGFWKSYTPAALMIVAQCGVLLVLSTAPDPLHLILREIVAGTMLWLSYPLVAYYVLGYLGCRERFFAYIVPLNWLQLPFGLAFLIISLFFLAFPKLALLFYACIAAWIYYHARLARLSLGIAPNMSFALALFEFFLGLILQAMVVAVSASFSGTPELPFGG